MLAASVIAARERGRQLQCRYRRTRRAAYVVATMLSILAAGAVVVEVRGAPLPVAAVATISAMLGACLLGILVMLSSPALLKALVERAEVNRMETARTREDVCGAIRALEQRVVALDESHRAELGELERRHHDSLASLHEQHRKELERNLHVIEQILADRGAGEERAHLQGMAQATASAHAEMEQMTARHRAELERIAIAAATEAFARGRQSAVAAEPDAEALRQIYWQVYTDLLNDLGGIEPSER